MRGYALHGRVCWAGTGEARVTPTQSPLAKTQSLAAEEAVTGHVAVFPGGSLLHSCASLCIHRKLVLAVTVGALAECSGDPPVLFSALCTVVCF